MRQIVLDTETTGLEPELGHRVIEIGAVEIVGRRLTGRHFHQYLQPDREIDEGAMEVHGITPEFLSDKPRFHEVAPSFMDFIRGSELIIHNAPFDVAFLDSEFDRLGTGTPTTAQLAEVTDSLVLARRMHPGQKNSLDALCRRYGVDNTERDLHGALLDAELLADVFLLMTGGQTALLLGEEQEESRAGGASEIRRLSGPRPPLRVIRANVEEAAAHQSWLEEQDGADVSSVWRRSGWQD